MRPVLTVFLVLVAPTALAQLGAPAPASSGQEATSTSLPVQPCGVAGPSRLVPSVVLVAISAPPRDDVSGERSSPWVHAGTLPPAASGKSLGAARTSSLVGTLVPVGAGLGLMVNNASDNAVLAGALLVLVGGVVGPSAGHIYLGDGWRTGIGIGIRAAGVGAATLFGHHVAQHDPGWFAGVGEFVVISGTSLVVGPLYSFATLGDSARERGLTVAPTAGAGGRPALGVAVSL